MTNPLPELPGFGLNAALKRLGGKRERLEKLLIKFAHNSQDAVLHIQTFHSNGDIENAQRLAHQLKGSGANLGADALSETACKVEQHFKQNDDTPLDELLAALSERLLELKTCGALIEENQQATAPSAEKEALKTLLTEIKTTLEYDLARSSQLIDTLISQYEGSPHQRLANSIDALFTEFDIPTLQQTLDQALDSLNQSP